jgi:hypothetical protein
MTRIVTTHYRYKPPPGKRKTAPLAGPAIVTPKRKAADAKKLEPTAALPAVADAPRPLPAPRGCQWPIGERPFTLCGAPVLKRGPYCEAHTRIAWQRPHARLRGE